jgi:tryptophan-rich sensory protein
MARPPFRSIVFAVFWAVGIAVGTSAVMRDDAWYQALRKPALQPPDWVFATVWPLLLCLGAAAAVATVSSPLADRRLRWQLGAAYLLNGIVNLLWTCLFFGWERPDWALLELPLLWASVAGMIWVASRASRLPAWLLVPYLVWITFAGWINWAIVELNQSVLT